MKWHFVAEMGVLSCQEPVRELNEAWVAGGIDDTDRALTLGVSQEACGGKPAIEAAAGGLEGRS